MVESRDSFIIYKDISAEVRTLFYDLSNQKSFLCIGFHCLAPFEPMSLRDSRGKASNDLARPVNIVNGGLFIPSIVRVNMVEV